MVLFEKKLKWSNNLKSEAYWMAKRKQYSWPFSCSAGQFETGANFAVNRQVLLEPGGLDEGLGSGIRTEGGEEMEMFVRSCARDTN
jgi:hypothetical protein